MVADYHFASLRQRIGPLALISVDADPLYRVISIRLAAGDIQSTVAELAAAWEERLPGAPFEYHFLDSQVEALYTDARRVQRIVSAGALLAVLIATLGLLGLSAIVAVRRTKEVGIRKALGASVSGVTLLLISDFVKPVLLSLLLAAPLSFVLMSRWLEQFAYRVEVGIQVFVVAGLLTLLLAIATAAFHTVRTALVNPADTLRAE